MKIPCPACEGKPPETTCDRCLEHRIIDDPFIDIAVALKVPSTGYPKIDAMITQSRRMDIVETIIQGYANYYVEEAFTLADKIIHTSMGSN